MITDGLEWCGLLWCFYQALILTAPIHCWGSIGEQVGECYISPNLFWWRQTLLYILEDLRVNTFTENTVYHLSISSTPTPHRSQNKPQPASVCMCHTFTCKKRWHVPCWARREDPQQCNLQIYECIWTSTYRNLDVPCSNMFKYVHMYVYSKYKWGPNMLLILQLFYLNSY